MEQQQRVLTPSQFYTVLVEFLKNLTLYFPSNEGAKNALTLLTLFNEDTGSYLTMAKNWFEVTDPIKDKIKNKDSTAVVEAFEKTDNLIIKKLDIRSFMLEPSIEPNTKENIWKYIQSLTVISNNVMTNKPILVETKTETTPSAPATTTNQQQQQQQQTPPNQPAEIIKGIAQAVPEIFKTLNELMKQEDNPMAQLMKQMLNPNSLQTGATANIAANFMDKNNEPVMSSVDPTSLSMDEISRKLQRLEMLEKAQASRRSRSHHHRKNH